MEKILVSKCLTGENVKYNGGNNLLKSHILQKWQKEGRLVPVCPETDGGLPTPRYPSEIKNGSVISSNKEDVTESFVLGAKIALDMAKKEGIKYALLKERSPSCGGKFIYDGSFEGRIISGQGITAKLLSENGIKVFGEEEIESLASQMRSDKIPKKIKTILQVLTDSGYEAYLVGGCVRDILMEKTPYDYDITTNAKPPEIEKCFEKYTVIPTGIAHGTVTVVYDGENIEITTYRIDGEYDDNRHPKNVEFSSHIDTDLSRRDFTMNAIAMDMGGNLFDPYEGQKSIEEKTISCVGVPHVRFNEDGLRILRCIRFASVLSFDIDKNTEKSVIENKHLLKNISAERIFAELKKLLCGENAGGIIFKFRSVFLEIMPQLEHEDFSSIQKSIDASDKDLYTRLALFMGNLSKEEAGQILKNLKTDGKTRKSVLMLIENRDEKIENDKKIIKKAMHRLGADNFKLLLKYKSAVCKKDFSKVLNTFEEIIKNKEAYSVSHLKINGKDLLDLGYSGADISHMLEKILSQVIDGKIKNEKKALTDYAKNRM